MTHADYVCRLCVAAAMVISASSCSRKPAEQTAADPASPALRTVRINFLPYLSFGPVLIAEEEGYFAKEGVKIEFVSIKRAAQGIAPLAHGDLDVLAAGIYAGIFNAMIRGSNIRLVADKGNVGEGPGPVAAFLAGAKVPEERDLSEAKVWKELRLCLSKDNFEGYVLNRMLAGMGLHVMDLDTVDLPPPALVDALAKGTVHVAHASEPWLTRLLRTGHTRVWKPYHEIVPNQQYAYIAFGPTLLDKQRDTGNRFMVAYLKGVRQFRQGHTERNLDILAKHTKLDRDILTEATWPAMRGDGTINVESVLEFQRWAVRAKLMEREMAPEEFWEPSFVEQAGRELGTASRSAGQ